jgi:hypothetical protein
MRARLSQLHKTEAEWAKLPEFIPMISELIVFDSDEDHPFARVKMGDGKTPLKDLPFFIDSTILDYFLDHKLDGVIDAGRISEYKK